MKYFIIAAKVLNLQMKMVKKHERIIIDHKKKR